MNKKIAVLIAVLFISISLLIGCSKTHNYTSDTIKTFEKDIETQYPNINKVQVYHLGIEVYISYTLTEHANDDEIEKLFKTTEEYVNKESFAQAITKEDKAEVNSFGRAVMEVSNPDVDKTKGTQEIHRGLSKRK